MEIIALADQQFPGNATIVIADAAHVDAAVTTMVPSLARILALSFILLITAWTVTLIRLLSLDYPGLLTHGLIILLVAAILVVPHYRFGAEAARRFTT